VGLSEQVLSPGWGCFLMQFPQRKVLRAMAIGLTLWSVAIPAHARVNNRYAPWHLFQPYGYTDKALGPDRWHVKGLGYYPPRDYIRAMVFHRAAMLAKASNFKYFAVYSYSHTCGSGGGTHWWWVVGSCDLEEGVRDHEAHLTIVGAENAGASVPCGLRDQWTASCRYSVLDVLKDTAATLQLIGEQEVQELSDILHRSPKKPGS
jgi:hypothetical protein